MDCIPITAPASKSASSKQASNFLSAYLCGNTAAPPTCARMSSARARHGRSFRHAAMSPTQARRTRAAVRRPMLAAHLDVTTTVHTYFTSTKLAFKHVMSFINYRRGGRNRRMILYSSAVLIQQHDCGYSLARLQNAPHAQLGLTS
eukprot:6177016-Pleurochrysis_carterae.AAC.4